MPPWINKFYVLDLTPEKSFIKWCVDQGLTVFCISWVNPDARHAQKSFEDYMREGLLAALDAIEQATGEERSTPSATASAARCSPSRSPTWRRSATSASPSATLFASQVDFTYAGDLKVFVDEEQIAGDRGARWPSAAISRAAAMATAFNLLRSNDLMWPYVINNYLKGKAPFPFDLLYWNADATRMPAANHSFYLRNCYLDNRLSKGEVVIGNTPIDLKSMPARGPGQRAPAAHGHPAPRAAQGLEGDDRPRRQGHHLRHGRHQPQARRPACGR